MKKYKLLKDLPMAYEGDIVEVERHNNALGTYSIKMKYNGRDIVAGYITSGEIINWLEEIPEKPKIVWEYEAGDDFFYVRNGKIERDRRFLNFEGEFESGNFFLTFKEAEKELAKRKVIAKIKRCCYEEKIDNRYKEGKVNNIFRIDETDGCIYLYAFEGFKLFSPIGYFSFKDAQKILEKFESELRLILE